MEGERFFKAAVALTDAHSGTQFKSMLNHDFRVSQVERLYFRDEWRDLPLCGWNQFCLLMEESGNKKWLAKIKELDGNVVLDYLEDQLMQASRDGKNPNRQMLEATVKALQGVTALTKITGEAEGAGGADGIEVKFTGVDVNPVTGQVYAGAEKTNDIENIEPAEPENEGKDGD
ncbi:MAG: hypothetical protein J6S67_14005 [Methanobrevibacter sp.]|nr:hypothetical protein [Methanobrevibacter sp.]